MQKIKENKDNDLKYLTEDEKDKRKEGIITEENSDIKCELEYFTE